MPSPASPKKSTVEPTTESGHAATKQSHKLLRRVLPAIVAVLGVLLVVDVGYVLLGSSGAQGATALQQDKRTASVSQLTVTTFIIPTATASPTSTRDIISTPTVQKPSATPSKPATSTARSSQVKSAKATPAATPVLCNETAGTIITETIQSKVLNTNLPVQIYLPPCYDKSRYMYPTLYLIQGSAYYIGEWIEDGVTRIADLQINLGILPPFIIVMPASDLDRGNASKYTYSVGGDASWEGFMLNELLPLIESQYGAWPHREGRAIGGISRGAYWSLQLAFANPDKFGIVGAHSPSITSAKLIGVPANFSMLSILKPPNTLENTRIWLDAGNLDWAQAGAMQLSRELDQRGFAHQFSIGQGSHLDEYWASRMSDYLIWYASGWPRGILVKPATSPTRTQP